MTDAPLSDAEVAELERRIRKVLSEVWTSSTSFNDLRRLSAQAREANRLREREAEVRREVIEECARVADTFPLQTLRTYEGEGGVPRTYVGETKPKDIANVIRALTPSGQNAADEHEWFTYGKLNWECCRKCGIVRRADGKNK